MSRRLTILAPALALLLVLTAGCGGDDDKDAKSTTTTTEASSTTEDETTEPESTDDTTDPEETTESSAPGETTEPESTDTTAPGGESDDYCTAYAAIDDVGGNLDTTTIESLRAGFESVLTATEASLEVAPEEIAADVQTIVDGLTDINELLADAATPQEAQAAVGGYDDSVVQPASDRVDAWVEANCPEAEEEPEPAG